MKGVLAVALLTFSSNVFSETVFVTLEKDNALAIIDPASGNLLKTVPIGSALS